VWGRDADYREFAEGLAGVEDRIERVRQAPEGSDVRDAYVLDLQNLHEELRVADEEIRAQQEELERLLILERDVRHQHQRLIAALPAPILVTDTAAVIRSANAAACQLLSTRREALVGKPLPALVDPADRPRLRSRVSEIRDVGEGFHVALMFRPPKIPSVRVEAAVQSSGDGGARSLTWLLVPASAEGGEIPAGPALADAFSKLARVPLNGAGEREMLTNVASVCARALGRDVAVSIALGCPTEPEHVGSDGRLAQTLDGAQVMAGEGPGQTAWQQRQPVLAPDVRGDGRWPRLAKRIADDEISAALAIPVLRGDKPVGVFTVYALPGRRLGDHEQRVAELMAGTVGAILQEMEQKAELVALGAQLREALESRAVIDQAKGMIMMQERCDADAAFKKLVELSSRANVKLRGIAQRIVDSAAGR